MIFLDLQKPELNNSADAFNGLQEGRLKYKWLP